MKSWRSFLNLFCKKRYQKCLEEKNRRSEFVYDSIDLSHHKIHKITLNRGGS